MANKYNQKACDVGSGRGCNYLGVNYRDGAGFDKNMQNAYSFTSKNLVMTTTMLGDAQI